MITYQVDVLNPKADKLLQDLADLNLISLKQTANTFIEAVAQLRNAAANDAPALDEITAEVEAVRTERYARNA